MKKLLLSLGLMIFSFTSVIAEQFPITADLLFEAALGRLDDYQVVHKFGNNATVGSTMEDIWSLGSTTTFGTTTFTVEVISDDADDIYNGTGAQKVIISGLGSDWAALSQEIATSGTTVSLATTLGFYRVFRAYVSEAGTYSTTMQGGNEGTLTIRKSGAGENQAEIPVASGTGQGQTQMAKYTVPADWTAWVYSIVAQVDGTKGANIYFWQRQDADQVTAPFTSRRIVVEFPAVIGRASLGPVTPIGPFPEKTDIWFSAIRSGAQDSGVTIDYEMLLIRN